LDRDSDAVKGFPEEKIEQEALVVLESVDLL
jgi:hypothetical protein